MYKILGCRAELKDCAGHIWPADRMLCIPGIEYKCEQGLSGPDVQVDFVSYKNIVY